MTDVVLSTPIEPFRIHSVESIKMTTPAQRRELIAEAHYNPFKLRGADVTIDLLTDSGTGALSKEQWAALQRGDEAYAGSPSWFVFEDAVKNLFNYKHLFPTHQGRAAERILFGACAGKGKTIPSNTHFDTTRGNIEFTGATAVDLVVAEGKDPSLIAPFKGNMDIEALDRFLTEHGADVPLVMLTITNNSGGGQPVSLENIRKTAEVAHGHGKMLILDACRFAENAYFIKHREPGQEHREIIDIIRDCADAADGMTMSAKKDPMGNIGGWLALNDDDLAQKCKELLILGEGFPTYGGLAGRDLEALAQGLSEVVDEDYLRYRVGQAEFLSEGLQKIGVPHIQPVGAHAIYLDAKALLPHIAPLQFPGQALAVALYEIGGIRACEIGSIMFGLQPDGTEKPASMELVRLAIPRRTYTKSHLEYVLEACAHIKERAADLPGYEIIWQPPSLRHFTAEFAPLH